MTRKTLLATLLGLALAGTGCKSGKDQAADNTGRNDRDPTTTNKVADKAVNSDADLELTQQIRQAVVGADSLSMNAKNAKIIVQDQVVTLRGPVASAEEKATIEKIAVLHAGSRRVVNELEVAP
jgi:osmotically-inducible protein OsmY